MSTCPGCGGGSRHARARSKDARHDRAVASGRASVRAKVEHPFLIVKRDFGFTKTRYRG